MSETLVERPTPVDLRAESAEVIDVDDWVVERARRTGSESWIPIHSRMRVDGGIAAEPIVVDDDSDEEIQVLAGPSRPQRPPTAIRPRHLEPPRHHRRPLHTPPPPPQDNYVPPVPPISRHLQQPHMRRRLTPPNLNGVFRPLEQPFPFEQNIRPMARRLPSAPDIPLPAPPPIDNVRRNNMGLGGALLALNRHTPPQTHDELPVRRTGTYSNLLQFLPQFMRRRLGLDMDGQDADLLHVLALTAAEHEQPPAFHMGDWGEPRRGSIRELGLDYHTSYTHPQKPQPGFTFDFEVASPKASPVLYNQPGSSNAVARAETGTTLVCAKCLTPLVIDFMGSEVETAKRKIWGLRCGHLLDGCCIDKIMKPEPPPVVTIPEDETHIHSLDNSKGKGKAPDPGQQENRVSDGGTTTQHTHSTPSMGKRKAAELNDAEPSSFTPTSPPDDGKTTASPEPPQSAYHESPPTFVPQVNTMRAKLRPRASAVMHNHDAGSPRSNGASSSTTSASQASASPWHTTPSHGDAIDVTSSPEQPHPHPNTRAWQNRGGGSRGRAVPRGVARGSGRARRKGKGRGKGKGRVEMDVVEAEHEWVCPVSGCGRAHTSVRVRGVWQMHEARGAIAIYV